MRHRRNPSQKYHDRVAGQYETIYDDAWWRWHDALTWDHLKRFLPADLRAPVIDLGCGSGKWGRKLLKSGYPVTFLDSSARMVDEARRQIDDTGDAPRADFVQADLMDLACLPREHFALATAMGEPIGCTDDPAVALRQIQSVLVPGGTLVATLDNRIACVDHYVQQGDLRALQRFLRTGRTRWLTRNPDEQFEIHTFEPEQLRRLLTAAGFEVLDMIGKCVLSLRQQRELLEAPAERRQWEALERELARDEHNFGRCAHLQVAARKRSG